LKRHDKHSHSCRRRLHMCTCIYTHTHTHTHYVHGIVRVYVPKRYILILFSCYYRMLFGAAATFGSPRSVRSRVSPRNRYTILQWPRYQRRFPLTLREDPLWWLLDDFVFFLLLLLFFFYFFSHRQLSTASLFYRRPSIHVHGWFVPPYYWHLLLCSAQWKRMREKKCTSNILADEAAERNIPARWVFAPCINTNITHSLI